MSGFIIPETNLLETDLDFSNQTIENISFNRKKLEGANFSGTRLTNVKFEYANLNNANFRGAVFQNVTFKNAKLDNANFRGASFQSVTFENAKLNNSDFSHSSYEMEVRLPFSFGNISVDFTKAKLDGANFSNSRMNGIILNGASLKNTNFERAILVASVSDANFSGTDTNFRNAHMSIYDYEHFFNRTKFPSIEKVAQAQNVDNILEHLDPQRTNPATIEYYERNIHRHYAHEDESDDESDDEDERNDIDEALEVHRFSSNIDSDEIQQLLKKYLDKKDKDLYRDIDKKMDIDRIEAFLSKMLGDDFTPTEYKELNPKLKRILTSFKLARDFSSSANVLFFITNIILYVSIQPKHYRKIYLRTYINDTAHAYTCGAMSCTKGMFERFYITLGTAMQILCADSDFKKCNKNAEYDEFITALNLKKIDVERATQEWAENFLPTEEAQKMEEGDLKQNYIDYLTKKHVDEGIVEKTYKPIIKDAVEKIDGTKHKDYNVFKLKMFGGKKKIRRHSMKRRNKKNVRKSKRCLRGMKR